MKIKFNDATELDAIVVNGSSRFFQNTQRESLEFVFLKGSYPFGILEEYFAEINKVKKITLINDTNEEFIYDDYVLRVSMSLTPVVIRHATNTEPEVTEERISIVMAQKTYMENLVEQLLSAQ